MVRDAVELGVAAGCELVAEVARTHGEVQLQVLGGSMLPSIWPGDRLIAQRRNPNQIQRGKIILYQRDRRDYPARATSGAGIDVGTANGGVGAAAE